MVNENFNSEFHAGDLIYINFDPAVGAEIKKRRPAVIVSNDILLDTSRFAWVVPVSHGEYNGENYPLHVELDERTETDGTVYVEQINSFDISKRDVEFIEKLPKDLFEDIKKKARLVLG